MSQRATWRIYVLTSLVVAVALILRLWPLPSVSLWYDELQSVTIAYRPFPISLLSSIAYDPHPPLYNLFLSIWIQLGQRDSTIILSSVLLSAIACASLIFCCSRLFGQAGGLAAGFIFAIHPYAIYWSEFARMYSLVFLLAIWAFYFGDRVLRGPGAAWHGAAMFISQLLLAYSHAAGSFFAAIVAVAAYSFDDRRPYFRRWLRLQVWSWLLILPCLAYPLLKHPPHLHAPTTGEIIETFAAFVVGPHSSPILTFIGAAAFLVSIFALVADRAYRRPALVLFVLPFLSSAFLSYVAKPVWESERLFAFLLPFYCMGAAYLLGKGGRSRSPLSAVVGGIVLISIAISSALMITGFQKQGRFIDAAEFVRRNGGVGDQVIVPNQRHAWAFNWYFFGPGWDRDLAVSPAVLLRPQDWPALIGKIRRYDREIRHGTVDVVSDPHSPIHPSSRQIWLLARVPEELAELSAKTGLAGGTITLQGPGIILSTYPPRFATNASPRP